MAGFLSLLGFLPMSECLQLMQNEPGGGRDVKNALQRGSAMKINPFPASGAPIPISLEIPVFKENMI